MYFIRLLAITLTCIVFAECQYGPLKGSSNKRTTTPFPPGFKSDSQLYNTVSNSIAPEHGGHQIESSGCGGSGGGCSVNAVLAGGNERTPAGAASYSDNPWLSGIIAQHSGNGPSQYFQHTGHTVQCNVQGHVCVLKHQCLGGQTSSPGSGQRQCNVNTEVCCRHGSPTSFQPGQGPQPGHQPGASYQPGQGPHPGTSYQPGQGPQPGHQPGTSYQPGQGPQPGTSYQPGQGPQPGHQPGTSYQPGQGPQPGHQPGTSYQPGQGPQPGHQPGTSYQPGQGPQPGHQPGASYQPGQGPQPGHQPGTSYQPGQGSHPGTSYQPGQGPHSGTSYQPGQGPQPGTSYQPGQGPQPGHQPGTSYQPGQGPQPGHQPGTSYQPGQGSHPGTSYQPGQGPQPGHQPGSSYQPGQGPQPGHQPGTSYQPGQGPHPGTSYQPGQGPQPGHQPGTSYQPGQGPHSGTSYQPGQGPQPGHQPGTSYQPGQGPHPGTSYQPGQGPQPGHQPGTSYQPGQGSHPGTSYQPGQGPQPGHQPGTFYQPGQRPQSGSFYQPGYRPGTNGVPVGGSIYDTGIAHPGSNVTPAPIGPYTGPLNTTPHPGCPAALKCVDEIYCDAMGVMRESPVQLTREELENRVPLSVCQNIETGIIGKCCRDPNYKDPWPDMNGGHDDGHFHGGHDVSQFQHQHNHPQGTSSDRTCEPYATCTPPSQCSGDRTQPGKHCQVPHDGSTGICCRNTQIPSSNNRPISTTPVSPTHRPTPAELYYTPKPSYANNPFLQQSLGKLPSSQLSPGQKPIYPTSSTPVNHSPTQPNAIPGQDKDFSYGKQSTPKPPNPNYHSTTQAPGHHSQVPVTNYPGQTPATPKPIYPQQEQATVLITSPKPLRPGVSNLPSFPQIASNGSVYSPKAGAPLTQQSFTLEFGQSSVSSQSHFSTSTTPSQDVPAQISTHLTPPDTPPQSGHGQPPSPGAYPKPSSVPFQSQKGAPGSITQGAYPQSSQPSRPFSSAPGSSPQSGLGQPTPYKPQSSVTIQGHSSAFSPDSKEAYPRPSQTFHSFPSTTAASPHGGFEQGHPSSSQGAYQRPFSPSETPATIPATSPQKGNFGEFSGSQQSTPQGVYQHPSSSSQNLPSTSSITHHSSSHSTNTKISPPNFSTTLTPVDSNDITTSKVRGPPAGYPFLAPTTEPTRRRPAFTPAPGAAPQPGQECGVRREGQRPNGPSGLETAFGEFPWQAQILNESNQAPLCSGAILSPKVIVTAAHCIDSLTSDQLAVKSGDWKLASENLIEEPKPAQLRGVTAVARHPNYDPNSRFYDMAVLIMSEPLHLDLHVDVLCLGENTPPGQKPRGTNCVVSGWGKGNLQSNAPGSIMHSIPVNFIESNQCEESFRKTNLGKYFQLNKSFVCAVPTSPNHDLCQVDVGSPIACQKPDGRYELAGLYSWDTGCHQNPKQPTVASTIDKPWVQSIMNKPVDQVRQEEKKEQERKDNLGFNPESSDLTKPGFSQGYGKK